MLQVLLSQNKAAAKQIHHITANWNSARYSAGKVKIQIYNTTIDNTSNSSKLSLHSPKHFHKSGPSSKIQQFLQQFFTGWILPGCDKSLDVNFDFVTSIAQKSILYSCKILRISFFLIILCYMALTSSLWWFQATVVPHLQNDFTVGQKLVNWFVDHRKQFNSTNVTEQNIFHEKAFVTRTTKLFKRCFIISTEQDDID